MTAIQWLQECADPAAAGLGGKGGSLARLVRGGFPVPAGFVVCAGAYREWVEHNHLRFRIEELLETPDLHLPRVAREAVTRIAPYLEASELPDSLAVEIHAAYTTLRDRRGEDFDVAVRSSALSEDGSAASSAGLYETYLNIRDAEGVQDAVTRCYRSLWAHRAVQYRAFKKIDSRREAMAVVVMVMVPSDASGVAFTANPLSGSVDEIVINASWGLGEAVVAGRVTPDCFVVRKRDLEIISRELFEKEVMVLPDPTGLSGTTLVSVPEERIRAASLSDEQVKAIGRMCIDVEAFYGAPQDVEWAIRADEIYLLQSRPVTVIR
jgi:pyruvate,water dikinase